MKLARPYRRAPLEIARVLADELAREANATPGTTPVGSVDVAAPGFVNVRYADRALAGAIDGILASPADWGRVPAERPRRVNVEFVSANPTGPLTIGNARGAFVGDLLCRVLEAGGQRVVAGVLLQRLGQPGPQAGRLGPRHSAGTSRSRRMATTATTSASLPRPCRTRSGPPPRPAAAERAGDRRALGLGAGAGRDRGLASSISASISTCGRPSARCMTRVGWSGPSNGSAPAATSTSRTARSGSARRPLATTRTG